MSKWPLYPLFCGLLIIAESVFAQVEPSPAPAPAPTLAPAPVSAGEADFSDIESVLKKLDFDRQDLVGNQVKALSAQLSSLLGQAATLIEAYKNAYEFVSFEGDQKEHAKAKEWEQKNKALFQDDSFRWALRAHVQYLLATLTKRIGDDEGAMNMTREWIASFPTVPDKFKEAARQEILTGGISGSVFLRANSQTYDFSSRRVGAGGSRGSSGAAGQQISILQGLANWHAGNLADLPEVHRVNIIGHLRSKRDPRIFEEWKNNIALEKQMAETDSLASRREHYIMHRRPWLLWQVGKDHALFGQPRQAVETMMAGLKESPRCNDYYSIVAEIHKVIAEARKPRQPPAP